MKFLQSFTCFLLTSIAGVIASPVAAPVEVKDMLEARQAQVAHYDACAYPKYNITVINFEYTQNQKLYDHRGLEFYGWSGFKRYDGYGTDGWSINPSNYTTAHYSWDGREQWKLGFKNGPRASFSYVHSFWFYVGFIGGPAGVSVPIEIHGSGPLGSNYIVIQTDSFHDGVWEHVCLDWAVEDITIVVPSCWQQGKGCESSVFEVDDIWVSGAPHEPIREVKEPLLEYD